MATSGVSGSKKMGEEGKKKGKWGEGGAGREKKGKKGVTVGLVHHINLKKKKKSFSSVPSNPPQNFLLHRSNSFDYFILFFFLKMLSGLLTPPSPVN